MAFPRRWVTSECEGFQFQEQTCAQQNDRVSMYVYMVWSFRSKIVRCLSQTKWFRFLLSFVLCLSGSRYREWYTFLKVVGDFSFVAQFW